MSVQFTDYGKTQRLLHKVERADVFKNIYLASVRKGGRDRE